MPTLNARKKRSLKADVPRSSAAIDPVGSRLARQNEQPRDSRHEASIADKIDRSVGDVNIGFGERILKSASACWFASIHRRFSRVLLGCRREPGFGSRQETFK